MMNLISKSHFSRICIEVDLEKPLISKYELKCKIKRVEYEGIHLIYFACDTYNHEKEDCSIMQQSIPSMSKKLIDKFIDHTLNDEENPPKRKGRSKNQPEYYYGLKKADDDTKEIRETSYQRELRVK